MGVSFSPGRKLVSSARIFCGPILCKFTQKEVLLSSVGWRVLQPLIIGWPLEFSRILKNASPINRATF